MNLYPRKDIHLQALDNCRVINKGDSLEVEIGSISIQLGSGASEYWAWAIDTATPCGRTRPKPAKAPPAKPAEAKPKLQITAAEAPLRRLRPQQQNAPFAAEV